MIGKSGKCPQCGAGFVVPNPTDMIVFLCPNGHKLNGPKVMQGKAGQCPHCGSKFRIPVYDEQELAEMAAAATAESGSHPRQPPVFNSEGGAASPFNQVEEVQEIADEPPSAPIELSPEAHPLARVFAQLWNYLGDGPIDVQLRDGQTLRVDSISLPLSQESHAVFAQELPDGVRAVAAPWEAVSRIVFPRFDRFPDDLFL
jgi:hypothetical protein